MKKYIFELQTKIKDKNFNRIDMHIEIDEKRFNEVNHYWELIYKNDYIIKYAPLQKISHNTKMALIETKTNILKLYEFYY